MIESIPQFFMNEILLYYCHHQISEFSHIFYLGGFIIKTLNNKTSVSILKTILQTKKNINNYF
jgi:hypothetical protein